MFQALQCSSSGGKIVLLQYLVLSLCKRLYNMPVESRLLSTGILYCTVQRVTIPDGAIQIFLLKMGM